MSLAAVQQYFMRAVGLCILLGIIYVRQCEHRPVQKLADQLLRERKLINSIESRSLGSLFIDSRSILWQNIQALSWRKSQMEERLIMRGQAICMLIFGDVIINMVRTRDTAHSIKILLADD